MTTARTTIDGLLFSLQLRLSRSLPSLFLSVPSGSDRIDTGEMRRLQSRATAPFVGSLVCQDTFGLFDRFAVADEHQNNLASNGPDYGRRSMGSAEGYEAENSRRSSDFRHAI